MQKRGLIINTALLFVFLFGVYWAISAKKVENAEKSLGIQKIVSVDSPEERFTEPLSISTALRAKPNSEKTKKTKIESVIVTNKGDNLLVLINKSVRLPETYAPKDLVTVDKKISVTFSAATLRKQAADALVQMNTVAKRDGANPIVISAYRSYWAQQTTFSYWVGRAGLESAETFSARPGHSQHQLGTAVDFTSKKVGSGLTPVFDTTKEGKWLAANASKFGFVLSYPKGKEKITGYSYEPWHYRFIGTDNAKKMVQSGLILEEYLQKFGVW